MHRAMVKPIFGFNDSRGIVLGVAYFFFVISGLLNAGYGGAQNCFSLDGQIRPVALAMPSGFTQNDFVNGVSGKSGQKKWAALTATLPKTSEQMSEILKDLRILKNLGTSEVKSEKIDVKHAAWSLKVTTVIRPFLFVKVSWTELWAFYPASKDEAGLFIYQKTEGEAALRHYCGQMVMKNLAGNLMEFSIYEEVDSNYRSEKEILEGIRGTVASIVGAGAPGAK